MPVGGNGSRYRQVLLDVIHRMSGNGTLSFGADDVLNQAIQTLDAASDAGLKGAVLCSFNDLLRTGVIGLGSTDSIDSKIRLTAEAGRTWPRGSCHVTPEGQAILNQASRDPINPPGYLAYVDQEITLDDVTRGYVEEALGTYRAGCYKATAVLIGAAVERLVLTLRDELLNRLKASGQKPLKGLDSWKVKTALEAVAKQILPDLRREATSRGDDNLRKLAEDAEARLEPAAAEFRKTRNDAGHPASLTPVNPADVHANLLLFPSTAKLLQRLKAWVTSHYV